MTSNAIFVFGSFHKTSKNRCVGCGYQDIVKCGSNGVVAGANSFSLEMITDSESQDLKKKLNIDRQEFQNRSLKLLEGIESGNVLNGTRVFRQFFPWRFLLLFKHNLQINSSYLTSNMYSTPQTNKWSSEDKVVEESRLHFFCSTQLLRQYETLNLYDIAQHSECTSVLAPWRSDYIGWSELLDSQL